MARRRGGGRVIDFKSWTSILTDVSTVTASGTTAGAGFSVGSTSTILRIRGYVQAMFDSTVQVGDLILLTFGLGVVSADAFAAGAASLPDPSGDPDYPWLWWGQMELRSEVAAGPTSWGPSAQRLEVDSKAMRRLQQAQTLAWVIQATEAAGAPTTLIRIGQTRVLVGT